MPEHYKKRAGAAQKGDAIVIHSEGQSYTIEVGHRVRFKRSLRRFCAQPGTEGTVVGWCLATLYVQLDDSGRQVVEIDSHFHGYLEFSCDATVEDADREKIARTVDRIKVGAQTTQVPLRLVRDAT